LADDGVKVVTVVVTVVVVVEGEVLVAKVEVAVAVVIAAISDACFSISASILCLRILESTPSKLVVFFLALPLGPPSPVLLGVNFGADISSIKSKSDFSSGL
jgi:hypothetical protein